MIQVERSRNSPSIVAASRQSAGRENVGLSENPAFWRTAATSTSHFVPLEKSAVAASRQSAGAEQRGPCKESLVLANCGYVGFSFRPA
jgi:hypothetical protein